MWHIHHMAHGTCIAWHMQHMAYASHGTCITWHMHHMAYASHAWHGICMTWHMYDSCMRQTGCCYLGAVFTPCLLQRSLLTPHMSGSYTLYWLYYTHCHSVVIIVIIHAQTACWLCTHATEPHWCIFSCLGVHCDCMMYEYIIVSGRGKYRVLVLVAGVLIG